MKAVSLLKRLATLKKKEFVEPAGPITLSPAWQELKEIELGFLEPRFPDAYLAMLAEFDQIETEDRERGKPDGLQLRSKGKIPWKETEEGRWHLLTCRLGWYGVMGRYRDASIAMAAEMRRLAEEGKEGLPTIE